MSEALTLYAWEVSYFGGKLRSYLRHKGIPYTEVRPTIFDYYFKLKRRTGVAAIPVVVLPEGAWLQDTSEIIDFLEHRYPQRAVIPATPVQRFSAYLLEMWGDEFWIPTGLHTRWCHMEENYAFLEQDMAENLLPGWPRWLQDKASAKVAQHMADFLTSTGVVPEQFELLHRWTLQQLDWLDAHFATSPYLLGDRPSLGDFGLMGPLYGHLSRDPWPAQHLIKPRPHLKAWIERMNERGRDMGEYQPRDTIPDTLLPLLSRLLTDMLSYLEGNLEQLRQFMLVHPGADSWPRFIGSTEISMLDGRYSRPAMPYVLWMYQRMMAVFRASADDERDVVRQWLREQAAERLLDLDVPKLKRKGLCAVLDR